MEHKFPQIRPHPFPKIFRPHTPADAIDLITQLLQYTPQARLTAVEALCHPFFDELREEDVILSNGRPMPDLFNFTREELSVRPDLIKRLVPSRVEGSLRQQGIDVNHFDPIPLESLRVKLD